MVALLAIPLTILSVSREPIVQDFLARAASAWLTEKLDTHIEIKGLYVDLMLNATVKDILIKDRNDANILKSNKIRIGLEEYSSKKRKLRFSNIFIDQAEINLIKYQGDSVINLAFIIESFKKSEKDTATIKADVPPWEFSCHKLKIYKSSFALSNKNRPVKDEGMEYSNLHISKIDLNLHDLKMLGDTITCRINDLSATEKCGFELNKLKGQFKVSPAGVYGDHLKLITPRSELSMNLKFLFDGFNAFNDFVNDVRIETVMGNSRLNLFDIGYFAPSLFDLENEIIVSGTFLGPVSALRAKNFKFNYGKRTRLIGNLRINGLPDIYETFAHLELKELTTDVEDIQSFSIPGALRHIILPKQFAIFKKISVEGLITGFYSDFVATANISTGIGALQTDVAMKHDTGKDAVFYKGHVKATDFNIGEFLGLSDYLGTLNLDSEIKGSGLTGETAVVDMNGMLDSLEFKGEQFDRIRIKGELANKKFNGFLNVQDEKIGLDFDGKIDFESQAPVFDFLARITDAKLYDLNLLDRDSVVILSTVMNVNFKGLDLDDLSGSVRIDSTSYTEGENHYSMDHLALSTLKDSADHIHINFQSDFADARVDGGFRFADLYPSIQDLSAAYLGVLERSGQDIRVPSSPQDMSFNLLLKKPDDLTNLFIPTLDLADSTLIWGSLNTGIRELTLSAKSDSVIFNKIKFFTWHLNANTDPDAFQFVTGADSVHLREVEGQDSLTLGIDKFAISTKTMNDTVKYNISWNDQEVSDMNMGDIDGFVSLAAMPLIESKITNARLEVNDTSWFINKNNFFKLDTNSYSISDFSVYNETQEFLINGTISEIPTDTFALGFKNWDISNFDMIFTNPGIDLDGYISGGLKLVDLYRKPNFLSDLSIGDFHLNSIRMGDLMLHTNWDNMNNSLEAKVEIVNKGNVGEAKTLFLEGKYQRGKATDELDFEASLTNFNLRALNPFVTELFSDIEGFASGELSLKGPAGKPELFGYLQLMRTGLRVNYLNTAYNFANQVKFDKEGILFDEIVLYDSLGHTALVKGGIYHNIFNDFYLDVEIQPENFACLNTSRSQNKVFYGEAFATGIATVKGPFDNISMDIKALTNKGTSVKIPISTDMELYERDYIVFVNTQDTTREKQSYNVNLAGFNLDFELAATPDAEVQIFLPANMGNIEADGTGNIKLGIDPQGDFLINGDYKIKSGTFLFTLRNLVNRKFEILEGGKISWTGSPYDADIRLKALYRVKTSLDGLGLEVDSTSQFNRRVNVNCIVELKNQLFDPEIHFSIQLPDVDDQTRQLVYSILDTTDDAQMNQQMISLLVLGSFSYRTQSFEQSSAKLLSNQLSNWLSQISKDFDIGVNYRPGDQISEEELEVALSTQLFNDRVIIDGNFGVVGEDRSSNASNIVGDVNVEVKLTEDGRFRVKAFNRSNYNSIYDVTTFDDIAPYTQGVGVFYRKEFNTFGELFKRKKKKKEEAKQQTE